ncbi:unnamed protein product, partial [Polarella glacialis]
RGLLGESTAPSSRPAVGLPQLARDRPPVPAADSPATVSALPRGLSESQDAQSSGQVSQEELLARTRQAIRPLRVMPLAPKPPSAVAGVGVARPKPPAGASASASASAAGASAAPAAPAAPAPPARRSCANRSGAGSGAASGSAAESVQ